MNNEKILNIIEEMKQDILRQVNQKNELIKIEAEKNKNKKIVARLENDIQTFNHLSKKENKLKKKNKDLDIIINILNKIKISSDISDKEELLKFHSFYNGQTLFYKDDIFQYKPIQIKQIIFNHIFNMLNGFLFYNFNENTMKSYNLLLFGIIGYTPIKIPFAQSKRAKLYDLYKDKINNLILFGLNKINYDKYFLNLINENKCFFIEKINDKKALDISFH